MSSSLLQALIGLFIGVMGFAVAEFFAGRDAGEDGKLKSVKIKYKDNVIHIHHWLYGAIGAVLWREYSATSLVPYFLIGMTLQGLTYRDFYRLIYKEKEG